MQVTPIRNQVSFGQIQMDKEAERCFNSDAVADLKNCNSFDAFFKKLDFAQKAPIDFFVNGDGAHNFRAVAIDQQSGQYFGRTVHHSVHNVINNLIDIVQNTVKKVK